MRPSWTLTAKLVATGSVFLVLALGSIGLTLWVTWNLEGGAAAVNEAGRMRMQTYRLAVTLSSPDISPHVATLAGEFDQSLELLAAGDPSRPLFVPWSPYSRSRFEEVRQHWNALRERWLTRPGTPAEVRRDADLFVGRVDEFVSAVEAEIARWTSVLNLFQMTMMALAIGSAVALMYAGYLLVLDPVARLRRGLAALQAGDLSARVKVDSTDEFGELSAGFNDMASTLQALYDGLEGKVREKTEHLEAKRQRLADLYEVTAFIAKAPTLEELGRGFARQVRRIARADASAVRWADEGNRHYLMLASDNLPPDVVGAESCVHTGECGCGQPVAQASTRVIAIAAAQGSTGLGNCSRAGFKAIVSIPVRLHERVLGELDLFYRQAIELGTEDRETLEALASHLASGMESLRAAALEREAAVAEERSMLARELHDSIAQALAFMKIQVQLLRQASTRGDATAAGRILNELDTGIRECYSDVRELLLHFRTRTSAEDIEPALRTTLSKFEHQTGLKTHLEIEGQAVALAPDVQVQVLHILQEALSNVRKHARASQVTLHVSPAPHWRFEVRDDGVGFTPEADARGESHVGLRIMRERAQRIGAEVHVASARGKGCTVVVELPQARTLQAPAAERLEPA